MAVMDRRTLLKLSAALALGGCHTAPPPATRAQLRVVVVGAGVVGAAIAYQLAKAGHKVTVLDQ